MGLGRYAAGPPGRSILPFCGPSYPAPPPPSLSVGLGSSADTDAGEGPPAVARRRRAFVRRLPPPPDADADAPAAPRRTGSDPHPSLSLPEPDDEPVVPLRAAPSYDLWSLGAIFFELCTGEALFLSDAEGAIDEVPL